MTRVHPQRPHWWQWPTVLSLDAPLVVIGWQRLFGAAAQVNVRGAETFVLGASVWLAYVADRWFEGWHVSPDLIRTQRHRFHQRNRWPLAAAWVSILAVDLSVSILGLPRRDLIGGALLLAPTLLYLLSHQLIHRHHRWRAPKEICIAVLLTGGASVFIAAMGPQVARAIAGPVVFFAALCFTNVALIAVWEREVDESHGQVSLARQLRGAAGASRALPWLLSLASGLCLLPGTGVSPVVAACATASALLLGIVDRFESAIGWELARVLADCALLTPFVALAGTSGR